MNLTPFFPLVVGFYLEEKFCFAWLVVGVWSLGYASGDFSGHTYTHRHVLKKKVNDIRGKHEWGGCEFSYEWENAKGIDWPWPWLKILLELLEWKF